MIINNLYQNLTQFMTRCSFLLLLACLMACKEQGNNKPLLSDSKANLNTKKTAVFFDRNILSIYEDTHHQYWFGTSAEGVFCYDGKKLTQYTEKEGLYNNQVQTIQEDDSGNIWLGTGRFGISRYDGKMFSTMTDKDVIHNNSGNKDWITKPGDLWFCAGGGTYLCNNKAINYLPLPKTASDKGYIPKPPNQLGPYGVYSIMKDSRANLWFGTQTMGVCRYDSSARSKGKPSFTWFTAKGLSGPAVLALFEDKDGIIWMGNNGNGLFRYDPNETIDSLSFINFTTEKGLEHSAFLKSGKSGPGSLSRIYSINADSKGALWIGTVDAGVWRYDGKKLSNFTTNDGLASNAVTIIYKDRKGELWFGTDKGLCQFNGLIFSKCTFNL